MKKFMPARVISFCLFTLTLWTATLGGAATPAFAAQRTPTLRDRIQSVKRFCNSLFTQADTLDLKSNHDAAVDQMFSVVEPLIAERRTQVPTPLQAIFSRLLLVLERNPYRSTHDPLAALLASKVIAGMHQSFSELPELTQVAEVSNAQSPDFMTRTRTPFAQARLQQLGEWQRDLTVDVGGTQIPREVLAPEFEALLRTLSRTPDQIDLHIEVSRLAALPFVTYRDYITISMLAVTEMQQSPSSQLSTENSGRAIEAQLNEQYFSAIRAFTTMRTPGLIPLPTWQEARPFVSRSHLALPIRLNEHSTIEATNQMISRRQDIARDAYGLPGARPYNPHDIRSVRDVSEQLRSPWTVALAQTLENITNNAATLSQVYASIETLRPPVARLAAQFLDYSYNTTLGAALNRGELSNETLRAIFLNRSTGEWRLHFIRNGISTTAAEIAEFTQWLNHHAQPILQNQ